LPHCDEVGCIRDRLGVPSGERTELCRALHAEQNAIVQAALHGVNTDGATLYCTTRPCVTCAKMLINSGVLRIVFVGDYPDEMAADMLREAGVSLERLPEGAGPKA
jgi:dCMP deaminase